jgi:hypothetical protein
VRDYGNQMEARRAASREVVEKLWTQLREMALAGDALRIKLRNALEREPPAESQPLVEQAGGLLAWIEANDRLDPADPPSADRPASVPRHELSRYLARRLPSLIGGPGSRRRLRAHLKAVVKDWRSEAHDNLLDDLLVAGLTLSVVRYNPAVRHYYYHHVCSDVVPGDVLDELLITLTIPPWERAAGWVAERSRLHARAIGDFRDTSKPVALYDAVADLRGRDTIESMLLGERSWVALPLYRGRADSEDADDDGDVEPPVALIVASFPICGMFYDRGTRSSPWVQRFQRIVEDARDHLLLAFRADATVSNLPIAPRPSDRPFERARPGVQARALLPDWPTPDDPLGALIVLQGEQQGSSSNVDVRVRRKSFAKLLFQLTELVATCQPMLPERLRFPGAAQVGGTNNAPFWWPRHGATEADHAGLRTLYPEGFRHPDVSKDQVDGAGAAPELSPELAHLFDRFRLGLDVHHRLTRASEPRSAIDLVVPIVLGGTKLQGYLRFNCAPVGSADEAFRRFFDVVRDAASQLLHALARTLSQLNQEVRKAALVLHDLKLRTSLRAAFCERVAQRVARAFYPEDHTEPERHTLELISAGAMLQGAYLPLDDVEDGLRRFDEAISRAHQRDPRLPRVVLVSLWLNTRRPAITEIVLGTGAAPTLPEVLLRDRGLPRMLALLVEHLEQVEFETAKPKAPGSSDRGTRTVLQYNLESYQHRREDLMVVPPAFLVGAPGTTEPQAFYLDIAVGAGLTGRSRMRVDTKLRVEARAEAAAPTVVWERTLRWELLQAPRPAAFAIVPRGVTESLFGEVQSERIVLNSAEPDEVERASDLAWQPSGEPSKLLTQVEAFLAFLRPTHAGKDVVWLNQPLVLRDGGFAEPASASARPTRSWIWMAAGRSRGATAIARRAALDDQAYGWASDRILLDQNAAKAFRHGTLRKTASRIKDSFAPLEHDPRPEISEALHAARSAIDRFETLLSIAAGEEVDPLSLRGLLAKVKGWHGDDGAVVLAGDERKPGPKLAGRAAADAIVLLDVLFENAVKHRMDEPVTVIQEGERIEIRNKAPMLEEAVEFVLGPTASYPTGEGRSAKPWGSGLEHGKAIAIRHRWDLDPKVIDGGTVFNVTFGSRRRG